MNQSRFLDIPIGEGLAKGTVMMSTSPVTTALLTTTPRVSSQHGHGPYGLVDYGSRSPNELHFQAPHSMGFTDFFSKVSPLIPF